MTDAERIRELEAKVETLEKVRTIFAQWSGRVGTVLENIKTRMRPEWSEVYGAQINDVLSHTPDKIYGMAGYQKKQ